MGTPATLPGGCRILLTRAREGIAGWAEQIEDAGAHAVALPCIVCEPIRSAELGAQLEAAIESADWLVFTSARGVANVAELLPPQASLPGRTHVAVVGPVTEGAAMECWDRVDLVAPAGTAASLAEALIPLLSDGQKDGPASVVIAGPAEARPGLEQRLAGTGAQTHHFPVYRTVPVSLGETRQDLAAWNLDAIFVASPSAVQGLLNQALVPPGVPLISIGPSTTQAAAEAGLTVSAEATNRSLEGLLSALRDTVAHVESRP
ncbi:MAG TPA: uroporphyrinogen-III synthase [Acidobacteriota bacterium]|nr:uroporphyrinogen-III synthase [Acidobacteriota bacterium]